MTCDDGEMTDVDVELAVGFSHGQWTSFWVECSMSELEEFEHDEQFWINKLELEKSDAVVSFVKVVYYCDN